MVKSSETFPLKCYEFFIHLLPQTFDWGDNSRINELRSDSFQTLPDGRRSKAVSRISIFKSDFDYNLIKVPHPIKSPRCWRWVECFNGYTSDLIQVNEVETDNVPIQLLPLLPIQGGTGIDTESQRHPGRVACARDVPVPTY